MLPFGSLVPTDGLRRRAVAIAIELDHPIYDCFYLALAERDHARLGSDGGWLIEKAKALRAVTVIPL